MPIIPTTIVMASPTPISAHGSGLIPVSPVPSFDPYDLLPANLGTPVMRPVFIAMVISLVVPVATTIVIRKDNRGKWRWRREKTFDATPQRFTLHSHCSKYENCNHCQFAYFHDLHCMFLLGILKTNEIAWFPFFIRRRLEIS
jgi:hypothetical protein